MRAGKGFRLLLTVYTVCWFLVLLGLYGFVCETLSYQLGVVWRDTGGLPVFTERVAIPMIGGLCATHPRLGTSWVTYSVWAVLFGWPIVSLALLWGYRSPGRARWAFLYSTMGYGIAFIAFLLALGVGLSVPFMY